MVKIDKIAFSYGAAPVLKNVSLTLEEGKIYGLLGENGVGKTTLLTLICGLKKPQEGEIEIDGENPWCRKPSLLQDIYYLSDEVAPVNEEALSWARHGGVFYSAFDLEKFRIILKEFEVDENQKMNAMSSGQLKKTYISFALACNTKYILMDEPTNGLDIPSKSEFRSAILKYSSEDATIVISTHQVRDLENIIDPIVILDRQDVLLNASLAEISDKLYFDYGSQLHPESIFSEQTPGGFVQVYPNAGGADSKVNVEALFNATYRNKQLIKGLFSK